MTYRGVVKDGVVVLEGDVKLPDGAKVDVSLPALQDPVSGDENGPTLYDRLKPVIGKAKGLPADASRNVDHYLYGHPKR